MHTFNRKGFCDNSMHLFSVADVAMAPYYLFFFSLFMCGTICCLQSERELNIRKFDETLKAILYIHWMLFNLYYKQSQSLSSHKVV